MKQDYHLIGKQIERFFDGKTSNEEEMELYTLFSNENIPKHLLPYRPVFAYFETGIEEEKVQSSNNRFKNRSIATRRRVKILAIIAASLLIPVLVGLYHFTREDDFSLYEGSYIIRNGLKITDPKIVMPEIKKTRYLAQQQEKECEQFFRQLQEIVQVDIHQQIMREITQQHLQWIEQIEDENIRNGLIEILNIKL